MTSSTLRSPIVITILLVMSIAACVHREKPASVHRATGEEFDYYATTAYIGEMYPLPATRQMYTPAYLLPEFKGSLPEEFLPHVDSIIAESASMTRKRIRISIARRMFLLSGMDSVSVFTTDHAFVGKVSFSGVELMQRGEELTFIAVYEMHDFPADTDELYYCVNKDLPELAIENFDYTLLNNPSLDNYVLHRLGLSPEQVGGVSHVSVQPSAITYSIISTRSETFLTELTDNHFNILREMNGRFRLERIIPLPFQFNNRPLVLAFLYVPGTTEKTVSLGMYTEYTEYLFLRYNRLRLKSIGREVQFGM